MIALIIKDDPSGLYFIVLIIMYLNYHEEIDFRRIVQHLLLKNISPKNIYV